MEYKDIESLCCAPETKMICKSVILQQTNKK